MAPKGKKPRRKPSQAVETANHVLHDVLHDDLPIEEVTINDPASGHLGLEICDHPFGVMIFASDPLDRGYAAGLRSGDVIVSMNGTQVTSHAEAATMMFNKSTPQDSRPTFHVFHALDPSLTLNIHRAAAAERALFKRRQFTKIVTCEYVGDGFGLTISNHPLGVVVLATEEEGHAHRLGIRPDDVIVTINGEAQTDHRRAVRAIRDSQGDMIRLTYYTSKAAAIELVLASSSFGKYHGTTSVTTHTQRAEPPPRRFAGDRAGAGSSPEQRQASSNVDGVAGTAVSPAAGVVAPAPSKMGGASPRPQAAQAAATAASTAAASPDLQTEVTRAITMMPQITAAPPTVVAPPLMPTATMTASPTGKSAERASPPPSTTSPLSASPSLSPSPEVKNGGGGEADDASRASRLREATRVRAAAAARRASSSKSPPPAAPSAAENVEH